MKRKPGFLLLLLVLSALAGYLLSKASWVGRTGINLFYRQYRFLKVWWQAGLLVFAVWAVLFFALRWAKGRLSAKGFRTANLVVMTVALVELFFTYQDFRNSTAHRWLGERFHLGGYLFWVGWMLVSGFYLTEKSKPAAVENDGQRLTR